MCHPPLQLDLAIMLPIAEHVGTVRPGSLRDLPCTMLLGLGARLSVHVQGEGCFADRIQEVA